MRGSLLTNGLQYTIINKLKKKIMSTATATATAPTATATAPIATVSSIKNITATVPSHLLQGLLTRTIRTNEPKNTAQYFNQVADLVQINHQITQTR
jgi:hypothetical protein